MTKSAPIKQPILETIADWLKVLGLIAIPLWIIVFLIYCICIGMCQDKHYHYEPTPSLYKTEGTYRPHPTENSVPTTKRTVTPVQSEENKVIDKLSREDYYDYSDYYDDLDGEHSDIDYNEMRDYFED